ncbi:MAG TPA: glycosyltransferase family 4 protein [Anaeromyxobacteraceae bacterium]|nr:glycosyltransferase family 4 protein [Anaeromyxobacteraceae bacterium]
MKVLHLIDKSFLGGGQAAVRSLIAAARGSAVKPLLACRDGGPLVEAVRSAGVTVFPIPFDKRFRPGPARSIARIVREEGVDLLHGHGLVATTFATLARTFFGARVPLIYQQHGFHHHNYGPWTVGLRKAAERAVCRRADRVVADSRADAAELVASGYARSDRVGTIYVGMPEPEVSEAASEAVRGELCLEPSRPLVGFVGRLHPQKGVDVFLRAAALVRRRIAGCQFVVVGDGALEAELMSLATELGLDGALRWAGGRPDGPFLPLFDVAVLTSRWEGLPLVLLEYMAMRRPIVTTAVAGCLEAVGTDAAEVVAIDSPEKTAEAIVRLLCAPDRAAALGERARSRYLEQFTPSVTARRFETLYQELLS